jgi:hypothetical protein
MDMTVAALEGYMVGKPNQKKRKELEAYGLLWGHRVLLPDGDWLYSVQKLTTDSMAARASDSVTPSEGIGIIKDLVTSYWPQYSLLGDFHTHPYPHYSDVKKVRGYEFSEDDRLHTLEMAEVDEDFRLSLVLTIASLRKTTNALPESFNDQCITWDFSNYRFWLNACIALSSEDLKLAGDEESEEAEVEGELEPLVLCPDSGDWEETYEVEDVAVLIHCPYLEFPFPASEFGKKRKERHIPGAVGRDTED